MVVSAPRLQGGEEVATEGEVLEGRETANGLEVGGAPFAVDVELLEEHFEFVFLGVLVPVFEHGRFFEQVLGTDGRHLRATAVPLSLDKDLTFDVSVFGNLLFGCKLGLSLLFSFLSLFLLSLRELLIRLVRLFSELLRYLSRLKSKLRELLLLDEWSRAGQRFDMLSWHFNIDNIDDCLTEAVFEDNLDPDRARYREDMHLEGLHEWELKLWPFDLLQRRL